MSKKDIASIRSTVAFLEREKDILKVKGEVDPIYEVSGIQKTLEGGPALLFENIKGYPNVRNVANIYSIEERMAKIFGIEDAKKLKFKCLEAMRHPIPPKVVSEAPCQEVVITRNIDVLATMPVLKHTEADAGRILGGGNTLISGKYFKGGSHLSFNRMNFRGKDWSSISATVGTHLGDILGIEHRGEKVPLTVNIGTPPSVMMVSATGFPHSMVPIGTDELGFAGGLQGSPVNICQAKTVDAYSIAESEWVLEGYVDTSGFGWESDDAEREGKQGVFPFFPEWTGYLGKAYRAWKFNITAITHRGDNPIFFTPLARGIEADNLSSPYREACFYELAERFVPDLVVDVNVLKGIAGYASNIVIQVSKKRRRHEGMQRTILAAALHSVAAGLRLAVVVDDDVDIYSADDVLWAIITRADPVNGIVRSIGGGAPVTLMPIEKGESPEKVAEYRNVGAIGIDATIPLSLKTVFERPHHPVDRIDLTRWFSKDEIEAARRLQRDYAKVLARTGW